jgi:cytosine/adenosine deaminase-related metal-dependent hydrolase
MSVPFIFKDLFFKEVAKKGIGMVNCHAHIDRAFTITEEMWAQAMDLMENKWILMRDLKKTEGYFESMEKRFDTYIQNMKSQGIVACRTHVDADSIVGLRVIELAAKIRDKYKADKSFILQLVPQPLEGFLNEDATDFDKSKIDTYEKACAICDVVGGLPSRDRKLKSGNGDKKHADVLFSIAKNLGKDLDIHIDQENNPDERDTEMILNKVIEYNYPGHLTILHGISLACQPEDYRKKMYELYKETGTNCTVSPRAAIGMTQLKNKVAPVHNSIAPAVEMMEAGVNIGIGTDNISDIFIPNSNGDLWDEINLFADAVRIYDVKKLATIACENGHRTMKIS